MTPEQILKRTNEARKEKGLAPLSMSPELSLAAKNRGIDMQNTGLFSHEIATTTPNVHWSDFILQAGYKKDKSGLGENLARGFKNSSRVVKAWADSPTHAANLFNPNFTDVGLAVMKGKDGKNYVYQFFGRK